MGVLIKNGTIVTALDQWVGDVYCAGGKIVALGADLVENPGGGDELRHLIPRHDRIERFLYRHLVGAGVFGQRRICEPGSGIFPSRNPQKTLAHGVE